MSNSSIPKEVRLQLRKKLEAVRHREKIKMVDITHNEAENTFRTMCGKTISWNTHISEFYMEPTCSTCKLMVEKGA